MLMLRDFFHLPELDPLIEQITQPGPGLVVVAGYEKRPETPYLRSPQEQAIDIHPNRRSLNFDLPLPSGRSTIFTILFQQFLAASPQAKILVITEHPQDMRIPRGSRHQVEFIPVEPDNPYADYSHRLGEALQRQPGLLVIDHLTEETIPGALYAARSGLHVLSQFDTVLWGAQAAYQVLSLGGQLPNPDGLSWVLSVQRLAALCPRCRKPVTLTSEHERWLSPAEIDVPGSLSIPGSDPLSSKRNNHPGSASPFYQAVGCPECKASGRFGDVAVFDVFQVQKGFATFLDQPSRLPLKRYAFDLARQGVLAFDDLLHLEMNALRRTGNIFHLQEQSLAETSQKLRLKLLELEAANRVSQQRTEVLFSLHDLGQLLIASDSLEMLANRVCQRTRDLCGADRAILYYFHSPEIAEVLAVIGWEPGLVHQQINAGPAFAGCSIEQPVPYILRPPGVPPSESKQPPLRGGMCIPLIVQNQRVGMMIVHSAKKNTFSPSMTSLLQTFANQAALALQRAGLVEELQQKILQLEAAQTELIKKERMERELELARQVQQSVLPRQFPQIPGYSFFACNTPARQVGGDFYDVMALDENRIGIVIGDVSDKGMPAALYMALTRSLLLAEAQRDRSPLNVLTSVNRLLHTLGEPGMYVSVFYGVVDITRHSMTYARAGHDRPLLIRQGSIQALEGQGAILGLLDAADWHLDENVIQLMPGDCLVFYTDGMCDAISPSGEIFGQERLHSTLLQLASLPLQEFCAAAFTTLATFQGSNEQFDDQTLLVMKIQAE
jgi:serine phosphatase RsbU (regulator of sigma subunit)